MILFYYTDLNSLYTLNQGIKNKFLIERAVAANCSGRWPSGYRFPIYVSHSACVGRFSLFYSFSPFPFLWLEVQVKGIAGFQGFQGGPLPETKRAAVLISLSPAAFAVRFIRSKEYAREKGESCDELGAPPLRRTTLHRASGPLPHLRFAVPSSPAPLVPCIRFVMPSIAVALGPLHRREATLSWIEGDCPDRRGSATRGSQSPGSADFLLNAPCFLGGIYPPTCRPSPLIFSISGELHRPHPCLPLDFHCRLFVPLSIYCRLF